MIRITGHIDGSRFRLCIEDNGCGMNEDTEKLMQQILMEKHTLDLAGTGIGIQNVVTRLRMYYGEELSVVLESRNLKRGQNLLLASNTRESGERYRVNKCSKKK